MELERSRQTILHIQLIYFLNEQKVLSGGCLRADFEFTVTNTKLAGKHYFTDMAVVLLHDDIQQQHLLKPLIIYQLKQQFTIKGSQLVTYYSFLFNITIAYITMIYKILLGSIIDTDTRLLTLHLKIEKENMRNPLRNDRLHNFVYSCFNININTYIHTLYITYLHTYTHIYIYILKYIYNYI